MRALLLLLWIAGFVQLAIASTNVFLPAKLNYRENLSRVSPIIRQIFVVHSVWDAFSPLPLRCSGWFALPFSSFITMRDCVRKIAGSILR